MENTFNDISKVHRTWKHHLPSYFKLSHYSFDIFRLQEEVQQLSAQFADVYQTNYDLCKNHPELVNSVEKHYEQVSLTQFNPEQAALTQLKHAAPKKEAKSRVEAYRRKIMPRADYPTMDERNYNKPTPFFENSYIKDCIDQFPESPMRVRLVKLKPGKKVDFHIDYDPSFAMRIIVPVFTNAKVFNYTKRSNKIEKIHLSADGSPWFLNTGFAHSAENNGNEDRIILMFSLKPSMLLQKISDAWKAGEEELSKI